MLFYEGFIKEIKKLEKKYSEINFLRVGEKDKNIFDLHNKNGEIKSFELKEIEECNFLKALVYSYVLKKYSDINELESITNNFNIPGVLIVNSVLLTLEVNEIDIDVHLEKYKEVMKRESEDAIALFLRELYNYYIDNESITEEFLDMNAVHKGMVDEKGYDELRKLLLKYTALELIVDSSHFDTLDEVEKKLIKYSIFFGSIENQRCREIVGKDLKEIASVYYDGNLVDEAKIMNVINSIEDVYNHFLNKFKKVNSDSEYSFSDYIERFEALILAKDKEQDEMSKEKNIEKPIKEEKAKLPNFSASRFEIEEGPIEEEGEETQDSRLEILVDSIKSAKELKEDLEESLELHQIIEELIPAKDIIRKMKAKREQEIIEQLKMIGDILKAVEDDEPIILDFTPLDEVVKILGDKGYKIQVNEEVVVLTW